MFDQEIYVADMLSMVDHAIEKLKAEKPGFSIYTASIWTDPNSAASAISFDSEANSVEKVKKANEWTQKYYDQYIAEGDLEQAALFLPITGRNTNPADFELESFVTVQHASIPEYWEEDTEGDCWDELEPALQEVGKSAYEKLRAISTHPAFELAVNGREDWYVHVWPGTGL